MHHARLSFSKALFVAAFAATLAFAATASAATDPVALDVDRSSTEAIARAPKVSLFAAAGYLASPGANGAQFAIGARFALANHVALSADAGYGVLAAAAGPTVQDRWWIMPAIAYVIPTRRVRFDLGAGIGLGASSGYRSWSAYVDAPFAPGWAYQLMPTVRVHAVASYDVSPRSSVFARIEAAKLLASGSDTRWMDTSWAMLSFGAAAGVL